MTSRARGRPRSFDRADALNKAVLLFWRRGYEATSIRDLTTELGIGAPSLYHAFGDKRRLFGEALVAYDRQYGGFIDAALAEEPTARAAAARIFAECPARYTRRGLPAGCLVISGDAGTTDTEVGTHLRRARERHVVALANKIGGDVAAGLLPADTDAVELARYTMAMLTGLAQAARDQVPRSQLVRTANIAMRAWP